MRSEAQRMLLIKNNAGAYYFWNKLQIACLYEEWLFVSFFTSNPNDYTLREDIFSSTVVKDDAAVSRFQYGE